MRSVNSRLAIAFLVLMAAISGVSSETEFSSSGSDETSGLQPTPKPADSFSGSSSSTTSAKSGPPTPPPSPEANENFFSSSASEASTSVAKTSASPSTTAVAASSATTAVPTPAPTPATVIFSATIDPASFDKAKFIEKLAALAAVPAEDIVVLVDGDQVTFYFKGASAGLANNKISGLQGDKGAQEALGITGLAARSTTEAPAPADGLGDNWIITIAVCGGVLLIAIIAGVAYKVKSGQDEFVDPDQAMAQMEGNLLSTHPREHHHRHEESPQQRALTPPTVLPTSVLAPQTHSLTPPSRSPLTRSPQPLATTLTPDEQALLKAKQEEWAKEDDALL